MANKVLKILKTTPMQSGLLFHNLINEDEIRNYYCQMNLRLIGEVNAGLLLKAWQEITNRYEIFRTDFRWKESKNVVQLILESKDAEMYEQDLTGLTPEEQKRRLRTYQEEDLKRRFDFEKGKLSRLTLFQLQEREYYLIWTFHHILFDGWSRSIIMDDFFKIYASMLKAEPLPPAPKVQFSDYVNWLFKQDQDRGEKYWEAQMSNFQGPTYLSMQRGKRKGEVVKDAIFTELQYAESETQKIKTFCQEHQITVNALFQTVWAILLQKYHNTRESCVGMTVSGRYAPLKEIEQIVGLLINSLPVMVEATEQDTVHTLLTRVNTRIAEIQEYDYISLAEIQKLASTTDDLFDVLIAFENFPDLAGQVNRNEFFEILWESTYELAHYDVIVAIMCTETILMKLSLNAELFTPLQVQRIEKGFQTILHGILTHPEKHIRELTVLQPDESNYWLHNFNQTSESYPDHQTVVELFAAQVAKTPQAIAVEDEGRSWTYEELDAHSSQITALLHQKGVSPGTIVGLFVQRSFAALVGIFGILKAGGAYLPMDPAYPAERIAYILDESQITLVLTQSQLASLLQAVALSNQTSISTVEQILLDDPALYQGKVPTIKKAASPKDLAYVIYTSGSTGRPKGIMVEHRGLVNYLTWAGKMYLPGGECNVPLYSSLSFDLTVTSIFLPLLYGKRIIVYREGESEDLMMRIIRENRVDLIKLTPAHLRIINELRFQGSRIKTMIVGGENLPTSLARKIYNKFAGDLAIYNEYGPTETVVGCMIYQYSPANDVGDSVPIGRPADNVQIYLLDRDLHPVDIGIPGEIYISGAGVARGYLNQPELTKARFLKNPFLSGQRMYQTGDLARRLESGDMEFIGRLDGQVKVRGFRIELAEIENRLLGHPSVCDTVVMVREDLQDDPVLVAYVTSPDESLHPELESELRTSLAETLPPYMVPDVIVQLEKIPLTPNGKVNKKVLPKPGDVARYRQHTAIPTNETEAMLLTIWRDLLKRDDISTTDNFFEIGGHSLRVTQLIAKIYREMNVELSLLDIFSHNTIIDLAIRIREEREGIYASIRPVEEQDTYPASSAQKRLYIIEEMNPGGLTYQIPAFWLVRGEFNIQAFTEAVQQLVLRHESLRTSLEMQEDELVQRIWPEVALPVETCKAQEEEIDSLVEEFLQPFHLNQSPLFRIKLIQVAEDTHYLLMNIHHIIADGVSTGILMRELMTFYSGETLPPLALQYKDFAVWQRNVDYGDQADFWLDEFHGEIPMTNLPLDYQPGAQVQFVGDRLHFTLDEGLTQRLKDLATANEATLFMSLLAAYYLLLAKYTGQEDLVVGVPVSGREHPALEGMIGMFVNLLPMRNQPEGGKTFIEFLAEVKEKALLAYQCQSYPFEVLVDELHLDRDLSRHPLVNTAFGLNDQSFSTLELTDLTLTRLEYENKTAKFDLDFDILDTGLTLQFELEYRVDLFKRKSMEHLYHHFQTLLEKIAENPDRKLQEIDLLQPAEKEELIYSMNQSFSSYPYERTLSELFEYVVEQNADAIAVSYAGQNLRYSELNIRANQLARKLRAMGVERDTIVGVFIEPSLELLVGIWGILKAGGAYLPINPSYPAKRIEYMLSDSGTSILFTRKEYTPDLKFSGKILDCREISNTDEEGNLPGINQPTDLAYVIYTSGSTGTPKGVMIEQWSLINHVFALYELFQHQITCADTGLSIANISFDASVQEIFLPILFGARLVLWDQRKLLEVTELANTIIAEGITLAYIPPALLSPLAELLHKERDVRLNKMLVGVEPIREETLAGFRQVNPDLQILNGYGPTEATICTTEYIYPVALEGQNRPAEIVPIGKPLSNTRLYVLDQYLAPVPKGIPGEIYIAGAGLARGYLNRPELTEERFITDPFRPHEKMYRTSDHGKWRFDGNLEFIGRTDGQIKLRGYRIEPGEIEQILKKDQRILKAVVALKEDYHGDQMLVVYYTSREEIAAAELRQFLRQELPEYMLPSHYMQLPELPLNINGKIDRKALPQPDDLAAVHSEYQPPETEVEELLAKIWSDVLGLLQIGRLDHFFLLGGHSLKAMSLLARIKSKLQIKLTLRDLFTFPVLSDLARYVEEASWNTSTVVYPEILPVETRTYYPVSSAQRRLFLTHYLEEGSRSYNMPCILRVQGELEAAKVEQAFQQLIARHETLRTSFDLIDGETVQRIHPAVAVQVDQIDRAEEDGEEVISQILRSFIRPFDLKNPPLLRVGLAKIKAGQLFLLDIHHIIADGISLNILINEFIAIYTRQTLPEVRLQYKDYAVWQSQLIQSGLLHKQEEYWLTQYKGELPVLDLLTDFERPPTLDFAGNSLTFCWDRQLTADLNRLAKKLQITPYMLLLSVFYTLLHKYTGQEEIIVGTTNAGRSHPDLQQMTGMFVNTLALRLAPRGEKRFKQFTREVKECVLNGFDNELFPYDALVEKLALKRESNRNPLFDVMFALENIDYSHTKSGLQFSPYEFATGIAKFDLMLGVREEQGELNLRLEYRTSLFKEQTMQKFLEYYTSLCRTVLAQPDILLQEISLLSIDEKEALLDTFNDTTVPLSGEQVVYKLFETQVECTPESIAIIEASEQLTYRKLNVRANQLARQLQAKGVHCGTPVGIFARPSIAAVTAILAILKAGGTYVPLDPGYPVQRIEYITEDSHIPLLLMSEPLPDQFQFNGNILDLREEELYSGREDNLTVDPVPSGENLVYIIYTSGSTGKPKGVQVPNTGVVNYLLWARKMYIKEESCTFPLYSPLAFDLTVTSLFVPLISGNQIRVYGQERETVILDILLDDKVNVIKLTPAHLRIVNEVQVQPDNLKRFIVGGEKLPTSLAAAIDTKFNGRVEIYNEYGPTEATVGCMIHQYCRTEDQGISVPIGIPADNVQMYLLDHNLKPVGFGMAGELCIAGLCLARGYVHQPELTAERFIPNPFRTGTKLYRTGDLARWLPNGSIEYLERIDRQVKIRGYRIELDEIKALLLNHPAIQDAAIIVKGGESENPYLVAFIVTEEEVTDAELLQTLQIKLPDYMIPAQFGYVEEIPLTRNGKVDIASLEATATVLQAEYVAPETEIEKTLALIFAEILGVERIGLNDNFFALAGDSIKAIRIATRTQQYGIPVQVKDIFTYKTIAELVKHLQLNERLANEASGMIPLTPLQRQVLQESPELLRKGYQTMLFRLPPDVDLALLEECFWKLIAAHDALRIGYEYNTVEGEWNQTSYAIEDVTFNLPRIDLRECTPEEQDEWIRNYCTRLGVLEESTGTEVFQATIFTLGNPSYTLLIAMHQLVADATSWRILCEDLEYLYQTGEEELPARTISFKKWSERLAEYVKTEDFSSYPLQMVPEVAVSAVIPLSANQTGQSTCLPVVEHASIQQDSPAITHPVNTACLELSHIETTQLLEKANWAYHLEPEETLAIAVAFTLQQLTGQARLYIDIEDHTRKGGIVNLDTSRTVGCLSYLYPVVLEPEEELSQAIRKIKDTLRQLTPQAKIEYGIARERFHQPLSPEPEIRFSYREFFTTVSTEVASEPTLLGNPISNLINQIITDRQMELLQSRPITHLDLQAVLIADTLKIYITTKNPVLPVEPLCNRLHHILQQITAHCTAQSGRVVSATDLGVDLDENEFEALADLYKLQK